MGAAALTRRRPCYLCRVSLESPSKPAGTPEAGADPLVGTTVAGKYRVLALVARGGMGRIYRAEQVPLGREVALKLLTRPLLGSSVDDLAMEKRFLREAATCARLHHPNTVNVFDYGSLDLGGDPTFYMIMEFLHGRTLAQALRQDGPFAATRVARIAYEIARSLREAHAAGVVHRDLKPSNVMLVPGDEGEAVKVLDFGVAKVVAEGTEALTTDGSFVGSPRYTAPEQVRQEDVDGRADLYALGVVMWELLTGAPPFSSAEAVRTLLMHLNDPLPPFAPAHPVPPALEAIVRCLLEKAPGARFADAEALVVALRPLRGGGEVDSTVDGPLVLTDSTTHNAPAPTLPPRPKPESGAGVPLAAVGVAVVVLMLFAFAAAGLWVLFREPPEPELPLAQALDQLAPAGEVIAPLPDASGPVGGSDHVLVESDPSPAEVWIDGEKRGVTPYELSYDATSAAERPVRLELRRAGYRGTPVEIAGKDDDGLIRATLLKRAESGRKPPPSGGGKGPDDILLQR